MKHLIILAFAAIAFLAATTLLRSHSPSIDRPVGHAGMMSLHKLHSGFGPNSLPVDKFDDLSLVFSAGSKM